MNKIRKGDKVVILSGKDKGRNGEVIKVNPEENTAIVRGINMVKRHQRQNYFQRSSSSYFQIGYSRSEGRKAYSCRIPYREGWQEGSRCQTFGRSDQWLIRFKSRV